MPHERIGEMVKAEYRKMVSFVRRWMDSAAEMDAEDVVQDVLASLLERTDPTLPLENLAAYAYRSLRNRVTDFFRTRKTLIPLDVQEEGEHGWPMLLHDLQPDALKRLSEKDVERQLYRAMQTLKPIEQDVIMANELEGVSFRELSEAWEIPLNTLLSHKARGLEKLKNHLQAQTKEE